MIITLFQAVESNRLGLAAWEYTLVISNLVLVDSGSYKVGDPGALKMESSGAGGLNNAA